MKIDIKNTAQPSSSQISEGRAGAPQKAAPSTAAQPTPSTNVSLGSTAVQLRSMENGMSSTPPINAAKVEEIKQAISEGRFKINSEVIADRLISTVRDLLSEQG